MKATKIYQIFHTIGHTLKALIFSKNDGAPCDVEGLGLILIVFTDVEVILRGTQGSI